MAVRYLTDVDRPDTIRVLTQLARSGDRTLAVEAIRTLAAASGDSVSQRLVAIARNEDHDVSVRCEAIMSIVTSEARNADELLPLIADSNPQVSLTAVRGLTHYTENESVRKAFSSAATRSASNSLSTQLVEQLRFALKLPNPERPQSDEQWKNVVSADGDPEAGRRVFFDRRASCSKCHSVAGRGGRIGPDLTNISAAKSRDQILASVLHPSKEKSPDYQGYVVVMQNGQVYKGTQFHYRGRSAEMLLEDGKQIRFKLSETEQYRALEESLMPERLEEALSVGELRDLVTFLTTRY